MEKFSWKGHGAMLLANTSWGLMSPLAKVVMAGGVVTPFVLTDLRIFGAMVLFWAVSLFQKPEHVPPRDMLRLFAASLLAAVFLREPVTGKKVAGIAFGAGGALMLILGSGATATAAGAHPILGDLLVLFAQLSYATYLVLFKNFICRYSLVTVMKWMFTYAFLCTLPFSYSSLVATDWFALGWDDVLAVAFIVVFATFVSYMFIIVGQKNLRPTVAGMYNYVQPVVACVVTVCLGLDSFNVMKGLAVAMIFVGVFLVTTSKSRADERCEARR